MMKDPVAALRAEGLTVRVIAGYATAGHGDLVPVGIGLHHTASNRKSGDAGALGICVHGRPDLSGPLANLHVSRTGVVTVIALGSANHFGRGSAVVLANTKKGIAPKGDAREFGYADNPGGNLHYVGIEIENDGLGEPWSPQLLDAMTRIGAALCKQYGWTPAHAVCHREWTKRKSDPLYHGDWRGMFAARLASKPAPLPPVSAAATMPAGTVYLKIGSKGGTVATMQNYLGIKPVDGDWGPATDRAFRAWQKKAGLTVDGVLGPKGLAMMARHTPVVVPTQAVVAAINRVAPAAPKPPAFWKRTVRLGSVGSDVKGLQSYLGLPASQRDGRYGPVTYDAVVRWQRAHGLVADGIVGPGTAAKMQAVLNARTKKAT